MYYVMCDQVVAGGAGNNETEAFQNFAENLKIHLRATAVEEVQLLVEAA